MKQQRCSFFSGTHRTSDKTRPSDENKPSVESWLLSHFLLAMLHIHTPCEWWSLWPTLQRYCVWRVLSGGCFVLPADSSPPRVGPGRCGGVTTLINCLRSPVCVASCLPCHHVLPGFGVVGWQQKSGGGGWRGEGRGGLWELRRLQLCLSEQQCCRVEHGSQLARAWRGSGFGYRCLPFTALLCAEEEEQGKTFEVAKTRAEDVWGNLSLFLAVKRGI